MEEIIMKAIPEHGGVSMTRAEQETIYGSSVAATGGVSHSDNSFRSAWPERANLSTCYSSQSVFAATLLYYAESSKGIAFISFTS